MDICTTATGVRQQIHGELFKFQVIQFMSLVSTEHVCQPFAKYDKQMITICFTLSHSSTCAKYKEIKVKSQLHFQNLNLNTAGFITNYEALKYYTKVFRHEIRFGDIFVMHASPLHK